MSSSRVPSIHLLFPPMGSFWHQGPLMAESSCGTLAMDWWWESSRATQIPSIPSGSAGMVKSLLPVSVASFFILFHQAINLKQKWYDMVTAQKCTIARVTKCNVFQVLWTTRFACGMQWKHSMTWKQMTSQQLRDTSIYKITPRSFC